MGPTFEIPCVDPFTVGRESAHCSAGSTGCTLLATCRIQQLGGKQYEKPDIVKASMYVSMVDLPAVEQLPVVVLSTKACS